MILWLALVALAYLLVTLAAAVAAHRLPRNPVDDPPDWGRVQDFLLPARGGGFLEVWKVVPKNAGPHVAVLVHGLTRNRDMMTPRARLFGAMGLTTVMASARDHGGSSPNAWMDVGKVAEDVLAVLDWVGKPVVLYGHSAGAGAAVLAAARRPGAVRLLILESAYPFGRKALFKFYRSVAPVAGLILGPGMVFWMEVFHRRALGKNNPARLARALDMPVLLLHGDQDEKFPLEWASELQEAFSPGQAALFTARGAGHSDVPEAPGFAEALATFVQGHLPPQGEFRPPSRTLH